MKPNLLETIFETDEHEEILISSSKIGRKIKRVIEVGDGLNITKALKEKRKNLIKKHLGNKKRPRKIALAKFMEYFKEKSADTPVEQKAEIEVQHCSTLITSEEPFDCLKELK